MFTRALFTLELDNVPSSISTKAKSEVGVICASSAIMHFTTTLPMPLISCPSKRLVFKIVNKSPCPETTDRPNSIICSSSPILVMVTPENDTAFGVEIMRYSVPAM